MRDHRSSYDSDFNKSTLDAFLNYADYFETILIEFNLKTSLNSTKKYV